MNTRTMKMEFVRVFCVVLCLHYGGCLNPHNDPGKLYQNKENEKFNDQRNMYPSHAYNFNNKLSQIKQHELEKLTQANEPYTRQNEGIALITPRYVNSQSFPRKNEHFDHRNSGLLREQEAFSKNLNAQTVGNIENAFIRPHKIKQSIRTEFPSKFPKLHAIIKDNEPFKSEEPITLELQGVSPEYIESLIGPQTSLPQNRQLLTKSTQLRTFHDDNLKYLRPQSDYKINPSVNIATFQNPSAESVYKLNRALPYKINFQKFQNTAKNNNYNNPLKMSRDNLRNIVKNSRQIHDHYKTGQPTKRFTVMHPDGHIEYIDKIETIAKKHPNYLLVKSNDVMKYLQEPNIFSNLKDTPTKENPSAQSSTIKQLHPDILNQENHRKVYINSINDQKFPVFNKPSNSSAANIIQDRIEETLTGSTAHPKIDITNGNMKSRVYSIATNNISKKTSDTISANRTVTENGLPISRERSAHTGNRLLPNLEIYTSTNMTENYSSPETTVNKTKKLSISNLSLDLNTDVPITITENYSPTNSGASGSTIIAETNLPPKPETSANIINAENNLVLNPEISDNVTVTKDNFLPKPETSTNTTNKEHNIQSITEIYDNITVAENNLLSNPNDKYDTTDITKKYSLLNNTETTTTEDALSQNGNDDGITAFVQKGEDAIVFDILSSNFNITENTYDKKNLTEISVPQGTSVNVSDTFNLQKYKESTDVNNSFNTQIENNESTTDNSTFWFKANDQFWDKILNDSKTNNVFYFLFVPSVTNTKVDTKTTIYPNGTKFEERIETTYDEDGVPQVSKQTILTFKNGTNDILVK